MLDEVIRFATLIETEEDSDNSEPVTIWMNVDEVDFEIMELPIDSMLRWGVDVELKGIEGGKRAVWEVNVELSCVKAHLEGMCPPCNVLLVQRTVVTVVMDDKAQEIVGLATGEVDRTLFTALGTEWAVEFST